MKGKRLFITGIPTAGKSHLGKKLASETGGIYVELDSFRESLCNNPQYAPFVMFYFDKDEREYYTKNTPDQCWADLVSQSEGLWPAVLEEIRKYENEERPVIFEAVNILPHLAKKDLDFPGIAIIGKSQGQTLERIIASPRWGSTLELQKLEADAFFNAERPRYKSESEKYGYLVFNSSDDAWETAIKLIS